MSIVIENPTAEAALQALNQLPAVELARLRELLTTAASIDRNTEWNEEDLADFSAAGAALYDEIEAQESQNSTAR